MKCMRKEADDLAVEAEKKHDFTLIGKSNAFREKVRKSGEDERKLGEKLEDLKKSSGLWSNGLSFFKAVLFFQHLSCKVPIVLMKRSLPYVLKQVI